MNGLLRAAPSLMAVWAWACLGMAAATSDIGVLAAAAGLAAALLCARSFMVTALVELIALSCIVAVTSPGRMGFLVAGVVLGGAARASARRAQGTGVG